MMVDPEPIAPKKEKETSRTETRKIDDSAPVSNHRTGVKIDLGSKEFDLDNYEKF